MKQRAISLDGTLTAPSLVGVMILLDRSGSMASIKAPMEHAFAQFVSEQRAAAPDGMWLSLHQFDSGEHGLLDYEVVYERKALAEVGALRLRPSGGTPLRDALWRFGHAARTVIDDPDDPTERLLLTVITDGAENTSRDHGWPEVRELMQGLEGAQCETIWLGTTSALLEAQAEMPIFKQAGATVGYTASEQGVAYAAQAMSGSVGAMRVGSSSRSAMADYANLSEADSDATSTLTTDWLKKLRAARDPAAKG